MASDASVGCRPRESLKATAEHQSVRGPQDPRGHWAQGSRRKDEGLEAFVGRVADIQNHSKRQNSNQQVEL